MLMSYQCSFSVLLKMEEKQMDVSLGCFLEGSDLDRIATMLAIFPDFCEEPLVKPQPLCLSERNIHLQFNGI